MSPPPAPRVLVVTWRFPVYSETYVADHLAAMADRGWRVSLACVELDDAALADREELTARLDRLTAFGDGVADAGRFEQVRRTVREGQWRSPRSVVAGHAARLAPALRREILASRPDVVHAHFGPNAAAAALAVGANGPPVVADLHGYDITQLPRAEGWAAYRRLLAGTTIVVHSRFAADQVRAGMGVEAEVIPYDAATAFEPVGRHRTWTAPLRLLFVGRLVPEKGADLAIAALADIRLRRPELDPCLTVIGAGPDDPDLRAAARRLAVDGSVCFAGALSHRDVSRAMAAHDVLLVPSRPSPSGWVESFGRVAAEGVRSGMGVVASRSGGLPEAVGDTGVLIDSEDAGALADAVETMLDHESPATISAMAARREPFGTADRYDEVARGLLGPATRNRPADQFRMAPRTRKWSSRRRRAAGSTGPGPTRRRTRQ